MGRKFPSPTCEGLLMARGPGDRLGVLDTLCHMERSVYVILHLYIFLWVKVCPFIRTPGGGSWSPLRVHSLARAYLGPSVAPSAGFSPTSSCRIITLIFIVFDMYCFLFLAIWTKACLAFQ